jgi:CheY-like chemotaxis protein
MKQRLLLVDDETALLETMQELLTDDSLIVETAASGARALEMLMDRDYDCVVSDVKMPFMDGFSLIKKTREMENDVPFIFYSGHACEKLESRARELGALGLVTKPGFAELEYKISLALKVKAPAPELLA